MAKKRRKLSDTLLGKLRHGEYEAIIKFASKRENDLDVQIRDNYLNIYYRGGNLLRVHPSNLWFDEFYFHRVRHGGKILRKTHLINGSDTELWDSYKKRRDEMITELRKTGDMAKFCSEMKKVMDEWFKDQEDNLHIAHDEKEAQQQISMNNRGETDYTVIDLEYAVSKNSPFKYDGLSTKRVPRFDIIAVDRSGQLYVIELKRGLGAIDGNSGIKSHIDCFEHSIGRDHEGAFVDEMVELLKQKKALNLIDNGVFIDSSKRPEFILAFSDKDGKNQYDEFVSKCRDREIGYRDIILYVDNKNYLLTDKKL